MQPKLSIVVKLSLLVALAVAITAFAVNEIYLRGASAILLRHVVDDLQQETGFFRYPLAGQFQALTEDVHLLAGLQATDQLTHADSAAASTDKLSDIFSEMLRTTPHYRSITLIAAHGEELLRVERSADSIIRVAPLLFQQHRQDEIINRTLQHGTDAISLSPLHLRMENDHIALPHCLILEAALPLFTANKTPFGIVMIEADFGAVLQDIAQKLNTEDVFYITNENGDYFIHPDSSYLFASDLNHDHRIQRDYPTLARLMGNAKLDTGTLLPDDQAQGNMLAFEKYHYDLSDPAHYLGIAVEAPYRKAVGAITEVEQQGFLFSMEIALVSMVAAILFLRILLRPLARITQIIVRYRKGEKDVVLPTQSSDEIGVLAREFAAMMQQKNDEDWVKENLVGITKNLLGFKSLKLFADALLQAATPLIGAQIGVLYISDNYAPDARETGGAILVRIGTYAFSDHPDLPSAFRLGEGLVGQCSSDQTLKRVTDIPADYLRIASATGHATPREILLLPILFENRLVGVAEFATLHSFSAMHINFLEQLGFNTGVVINSIHSGMRTEELLEESRMTAEELQRSEEELKTQQEELQSSNEELEEKSKALEEQNVQIRKQSTELAESSRIVSEKVKELERASRYKSEFLANMSHELRTPLNSLLILARILASNEEGNLTAEQVEEANVIHSGGLELLHLINDILDLSKVEAGKIQVVPEDVPLAGIAKRMEQQFNPVAADKKITFHIRLQNDLATTLRTDGQRVEQILKNLLANAFKFTERGSVTLDIRTNTENKIAFAITDTGIGIDGSKLRDIFEAFQQEDGSTDRHYGGTGLGLTIARKFAQILGGEIRVESIKGRGSTFTLLLPLATGNETTPPLAPLVPLKEETPAVSKLLLIIEDDTAFAGVLAKIARKRGYECLVAADGRTGLLLAAQRKVTAIVLDLRLPDIGGLQVFERLRNDPRTHNIPVHIVTAHDPNPASSSLANAVGYLTKPLTQDHIDSVFTKIEAAAAISVRNLLIVEDDLATQTAIGSLLRKNNINMVFCATGAGALHELTQRSFDCIILDLHLPDMTGFSWLEKISQTLGTASAKLPPLVIYTAHEMSEAEHRQLQTYTGSIVIKGASSAERLLDEVTLFLHSVESNITPPPDNIRMQHNPDTVMEGRKILLVDDDLRNTFALSKILKKHGLTVVIADNGQLALDRLRDEIGIDLVIMDVMMPVMDGYQAIRAIRAQPIFSKLPILALTARTMPEEHEKCMTAGANDYLTKPVDIDNLITLLRVWLFRQDKKA